MQLINLLYAGKKLIRFPNFKFHALLEKSKNPRPDSGRGLLKWNTQKMIFKCHPQQKALLGNSEGSDSQASRLNYEDARSP